MLQSPRARGLRPGTVQLADGFATVAIPSCAGIETDQAVMSTLPERVAIPSCAGIETLGRVQLFIHHVVAIPSCAGIETYEIINFIKK